MSVTHQQFIAQARKYLALPHRHQGRAHLGGKNQAVDCVGLLVCVGEDLDLADVQGVPFRRTDELNYGPQPTQDTVHQACKRRLHTLAEAPSLALSPQPGNIISLIVKFRETEPGVACHVAIVSDLGEGQLGMIHSLGSLGRVVEHRLAAKWIKRIAGIFAVPGLT